MSATEPPRSAAPAAAVGLSARAAGRVVLLVTAAIGVLVAGIIFWRLLGGHPIAPLSWLMPLVGLAWLSSLGVQLLRHRSAPATSAAPSDRPSRRPPSWGPPGAQRPRVTSSGDRISA